MKKKFISIYFIPFVLFSGLFTSTLQSAFNYNELVTWKFKTGAMVYASPTIKGDTIFVGSLDSSFYAIDANSGSKYWEYKLPGEVRSTAAIAEDLILFESANVLYALKQDGQLAWKVDLTSGSLQNQIDPWDLFHSSPAIHDGNVYIGTENGLVLGFRIQDGKEILRCQTQNKDIIRTTPAISQNTIFFGDWDGVLYAYGLRHAKELWQYDTKQDTVYAWKNAIQAEPVIYGSSVYFAGRSSRLYSLNAETGARNWIYVSPTNQWLIGGIKIKGNQIYLGSSDQRLFQSFNLTSGELHWKTQVDGRVWGTPTFNNHKIYVISNSLYVLNSQTGEIESQVHFDQYHQDIQMGKYVDRRANVHSSPVLYNDKIIFGSDDGYIYALDISKL